MIRQKDSRHKKALGRIKDREDRTPEQQIARLDEMFGKGGGAQKERSRLASLIKASKKPKPKAKPKAKPKKT
jgi:hypothetical protein